MGGIFKPKTPKVQAPAVPEPVPIPDTEDPNRRVDAMKRVAKRISTSGRQSTFLTKSDKLGGS